MLNKLIFKKIIPAFIVLVLLSLSLVFTVKADEEYEKVILNGTSVTYNYTTSAVYMPVTYKADVAEMRGAWVTTVWNEDMAKQTSVSETGINAWKEQYISVLDTLEKYNMNTVFFQVRPANDAFYESEYNDWSKYLVAAGVNPGWNPLEWMIEVTHERDMYFQCWMNAFRVTPEEQFQDDAIYHTTAELISAKALAISTLSNGNFAKQHPECVLMGDYDSKLILNPADLNVHQHLLNTIGELITDYDIDGFHFDDYFYLSARSADGINPQVKNLAFAGGTEYNATLTGENIMNDIPTYMDYQADPAKYDLEEGLTLGEFRRKSLNNLMKNIRALVDELNSQLNKSVEFGSKPAAVWQSNSAYCNDSPSTSPLGSNTHCGAYNSNYGLFADTKYWVENGYVDWIAPQVYFDFQSGEVPYADIVKWWAGVVSNTNAQRAEQGLKPIKMYVAHGIYKYAGSDTEYTDANESVYQLRFNKLFSVIKGDAYYAFSDLKTMKNNVQKQAVGTNLYLFYRQNPVLPLPKEVDYDDLMVSNVTIREGKKTNLFNVFFPKVENASMYAIYRIPTGTEFDTSLTQYRINIVKDYTFSSEVTFAVTKVDGYDYYIQAVSDNYIPSNDAYKLDFSQVIYNTAPEEIDIWVSSTEVNFNDTVEVHIPYANDIDNDELTYKYSVSLSGKDGQYTYQLYDVEKLEDYIKGTFTGFGVEIDEFIVKVEISDGIATTVCYSPLVKFVDPDGSSDEPVNDGGSSSGSSGCAFGLNIVGMFSMLSVALLFIRKKK